MPFLPELAAEVAIMGFFCLIRQTVEWKHGQLDVNPLVQTCLYAVNYLISV